MSKKIVIFFLILIFTFSSIQFLQGQQRLEWERWGNFGAGKLVTKMSNTNNIGSGRLKYPELAKFPAFEYPYNPDPNGRHIYYAVGISFHVGGFCSDRGPVWDHDPNRLLNPLVESGDQASYRFYKGFHFDGLPDYSAPSSTDPIAVSDDSTSWPSDGWPATYPTTDPVLQRVNPNYPTVYNQGIATPIPLLLDTLTGFPGAGPNKYSAPGLYYPGQVVADQEAFTASFAKNRDDDQATGHLMVYTILRSLSWKGDLAEDFLYWTFTVTNIGTEPIDSTYLGMFADFDFPWASFQEYHTYDKVDAFAFDTYDIDEETGEELKIGYGWDGDGDITGATFGNWPYEKAKLTDETPVDKVALAGVIFLQTPKDTLTGKELGITSWDAFGATIKGEVQGIGNSLARFYWLNVVNTGQYGQGTDPDDADGDHIDNWTWEHPFPVGSETLYDNGHRCAMTINTGPFRLEPGETDTLICATVMGESRADLFKNAKTARKIFKNGWVVPKPPFPPNVLVKVESGKITLRWGTISENDSLNQIFGRQKFEGYKIFRSDDGGKSWGAVPITDENGTTIDYVPLAQYDVPNGITGASPVLPTFNRGNDNGFDLILAEQDSVREIFVKELGKNITDTLKYVFVDESVLNGFSYTYAVVAYGAGDDTPDGLQPLQNARTSGVNVVNVTPHAPEASTKNDLELIKVVPNPYRVINPQETAVRERMLKFTHLPETCTIRIFNMAGELIVTLYHGSTSPIASEEQWNLRSDENREVAPGLYFFHIESELGDKTGKFVVIK
ncbi:MAG: T9SS type A sorting domain-containing protein [Calditrichaeota bacterium]|nr:T9SS type A sorting domain-containing protein [Calditrichota bacterium]